MNFEREKMANVNYNGIQVSDDELKNLLEAI